MKTLRTILIVTALFSTSSVIAQHNHDEELHVSDRWKECSFQLDPSLTQKSWRQFTREAALVTYFRPLIDAKPMGQWNVEFSVLQWATAIDDREDAWNDTFVHPDSSHWLTEGRSLAFPGLTARVGLTDRIDIGLYFTKNPNANYGFWSAQLQYNIINNVERNFYVSARASFAKLFGPEDLTLNIYGADIIASKEFRIYSDWAFISPYVGVSTFVANSHETTKAVELKDEIVGDGQTMVGTVLRLSIATLGVEYNFSKINTFSVKVGVTF